MKSIQIFIIPILLQLLLNACSTAKYEKINLIHKDTLHFAGINDIHTNFYFYDKSSKKEYLFNYDGFNKKIMIFNFANAHKINEIPLKNGINSFYVHNLDSIFLSNNDEFSEKNNTISLINSKGEIKNIYDFSKVLISKMLVVKEQNDSNIKNDTNISFKLNGNPYSFFNFYFKNNLFFLQITPVALERNEKYHYPSIAVVLLKNDSLSNLDLLGNYPDFYKSKDVYSADYTSFVVKNIEYPTKTDTIQAKFSIINSFILTDDVYCHRKTIYSTGFAADTIATFNIPSNNKGSFLPITKHFQGDDVVFYGFKYSSIKYDNFRNLYYRTAIHTKQRQTINDENGEQKEVSRQNWSIICADKDFKIIDEIFIPDDANSNYAKDFFITKNGLAFIKLEDVFANNGITIVKKKLQRFKVANPTSENGKI